MKEPICVICGEAAYRDSFCKRHFAAKDSLFELKVSSVVVCRNCGSYYDGFWKKTGCLEKSIEDMIRRVLGNKLQARISSRISGNRISLEIDAKGKIRGVEKTQRKTVTMQLKKRLCENCIKISGGYHEAVLQLRGENAEDAFHRVLGSISGDYIVAAEKNRHGYDIKLLRKDIARKAVKMLEGHEIKKSYKHVTSKKGRAVYRDYYSVK